MNQRGVNERKVICVDMDEVIADALGEHLLRYNREFAEKVTPEDLRGQWIWDFVPESRQQALQQYMLSEDFFCGAGRDAGVAAGAGTAAVAL